MFSVPSPGAGDDGVGLSPASPPVIIRTATGIILHDKSVFFSFNSSQFILHFLLNCCFEAEEGGNKEYTQGCENCYLIVQTLKAVLLGWDLILIMI